MEDLYGKTINKNITPLELGKSSSIRSPNFNSLSGRITPVESQNKSARQQSAFSGNSSKKKSSDTFFRLCKFIPFSSGLVNTKKQGYIN